MTEPFDMGVTPLSGELRELGPYRLLGQLATGGMGLIYLARDSRTGGIAAVKTLIAPGGVTPEARKRFDREVRLARRVASGYTVKVLDADVAGEKPWMAMEYVPAPSLESLVVRGGALRDAGAVRRIAAGTVRALAELHERGIVHRDVKPLNILLTAAGPKVIDFGISHASDLTSTRLTLGTIAFAAPEQAEGQPCTPASDIYALGVTLYYIACGRLPYPETVEPLQQLNHVRRADITLDGLPDGLAVLIGDCLALEPEDRPSAEDLVRRLPDPDAAGDGLPSGWTGLIGHYAEQGRLLQQSADLSEARTITDAWAAGGTKRFTEQPKPKPKPKPKPRAEPQPRTVPHPPSKAPGKKDSGVGGVVAFLILAALGVGWLVNHNSHHNGSSTAGGTSATASTPAYAGGIGGTSGGSTSGGSTSGGSTSGGSTGGGGDSYTPSPTPSTADDIAFHNLVTGDCVSNYNDSTGSWTPSAPEVANCSGSDAYFRITAVDTTASSCGSGSLSWFHENADNTSVDVCAERNFVAGQCMFAEADGQSLSLHNLAVTPCQGNIPDPYGYIVQITSVGATGSGDCGEDRSWTVNNTTLCGKAVWKRSNLPNM
ncbi:hypothetical protein BIV57_03185 [Mangrovactinospora gilvigrisea]|uniref:mitogen-activated protein kinase kinase n=1 Tax=Mangrovactinospora gilvigrisea TaxID=1428644 RepID=A0A1J7BJW0_9ACTN|nr:serine/threonine-protein kinase [Mangrovactinospora gilvigrisea]OIV38971.1 hypothetical protein BIV57_03185 [Mangrovactinospora gilvigrisea]